MEEKIKEPRSLSEQLGLASMVDAEQAAGLLEKTRPFARLMMQYRCAMLEIRTKLDVLNNEMSLDSEQNPFESIECRLKSPMSILEKLERKGYPVTVESIEKNITDVAGVRVTCSFPSDIYQIAIKLACQDDLRVIESKDYIKNPKENGYRSLHLIVEVPIFLSNEKKYMKVEVQFRTIAMDFWASLEHKVRYKKKLADGAEAIAAELKECADMIEEIDLKMQDIRDRIAMLKLKEKDSAASGNEK